MKISTVILLSVFAILASCRNHETEKQQVFFENGQPNSVVTLKDGQRHGKMDHYFPTGEYEGYSHWENGRLSGEAKFHRKDGSVEQILIYKNGINADSSLFYRPDSSLQEIHYYDSVGRLYDFKKISRSGIQDTAFNSKKAIILPVSDTIKLGQEFKAYIRLGNRAGRKIEVIKGDVEKDPLLYTREPRLEKFDNTTAVLVEKPTVPGEHEVKGIVIDVIYEPEKMLQIYAFSHIFFVKD